MENRGINCILKHIFSIIFFFYLNQSTCHWNNYSVTEKPIEIFWIVLQNVLSQHFQASFSNAVVILYQPSSCCAIMSLLSVQQGYNYRLEQLLTLTECEATSREFFLWLLLFILLFINQLISHYYHYQLFVCQPLTQCVKQVLCSSRSVRGSVVSWCLQL